MADNSETIGSIAVDIVGDYSQLQGDIDSAAQTAQQGGQEIAQALNAGAAGADTLASSISNAASSMAELGTAAQTAGSGIESASGGVANFDAQLQELFAQGMNLNEALAALGGSAEAAGAGAESAAAGLATYDENAVAATSSSEALSQAFAGTAEAETETVSATEAITGSLEELGHQFLALAEAFVIVEGLKEFGAAALEASDELTKTSISLTALTGSATQAEETIQKLEALGIQDGLSMPSLFTAATRMQALLGPSADVVGLLGQIANAATVMGTDIGTAANAFDRMAASGTLGARQVVALGLSLQQVADAMNQVSGSSDATAQNVAQLFKAMDQSDRIDVLSASLEHLSGIAQQAAEQTFGGQWQSLANQWDQIMENVGQALLPVISGLTDLIKVDILPWVKDISDAFRELPAPVQDVIVAVGLLAAAVPVVTLALGAMGLALSGLGEIAPIVTGVLGTLGLTSATVAAEETAAAGASEALGAATTGVAGIIGVGLVSAVTGALLAFVDLKNSMADLNAQETAMDAQFQKYITGLASGATTQQQVTDAQNKINLALSEGLVSAQQAAQGLTLLDAAEKKILGNDVGKMLQGMGVSIQLVTTSISPAQAAVDGLSAKMGTLKQNVSDAQQALIKADQALKDGTGTAADVAAAYDKLQSAQKALTGSTQQAIPVYQEVQKALKAFDDSLTYYPTAAGEMLNAADAQNAKLQILQNNLLMAEADLQRMIEADDGSVSSALRISAAYDSVSTATNALDQFLGVTQKDLDNLNKTFANALTIVPPVKQSLSDMATTMTQLGGAGVTMGNQMDSADIILQKMGITVNDSGQAMTKMIGLYLDLGQTSDETLSDEDAAWAKISGQLNKLSQSDMPLVIQVYDQHIRQLETLGATEGQILDAQAKELQMEIALAGQMGKDASDEVIALNNIQLKREALITQAQGWGAVEVGVTNDIIKGLENIGQPISQVIVEGGNMAQAFVKVGQQIAETCLTTIINGGIKLIISSIVNSLIPSIASIGTTAASSMASAASSSVDLGKSMTDMINGVAKTASSSAQGVASATTSAMSSMASSFMSTLGAVSAAVGAVSSIIGNIQQAHANNLLGEIEVSTRESDAKLTDVTSVLYKIMDAENNWQAYALPDLDQTKNGVLDLHGDLANVLNSLNSGFQGVISALSGLMGGISSGGSGLQFPSGGIPNSPGPPGLPISPSMARVSSSVSNQSSVVNSGGNTTNNITLAVTGGDPQATSAAIMQMLKQVVPSFGKANS